MNEMIYAAMDFWQNAPQVQVLGLSIKLYLLIAGGVALVWLLCYILRSCALQRLSSERRLSGGIWAWFPIGMWWVLGNIADDYSQKARGKRRHKRRWLLWLSVATVLIAAILAGIPVAYALAAQQILPAAVLAPTVITILGYTLVAALLVLWLVRLIFGIFALSAIYTSCDPDKAVANLIVSIVLPITIPFILFACRERDFGMPPAKMSIEIPNTWKPHS